MLALHQTVRTLLGLSVCRAITKWVAYARVRVASMAVVRSVATRIRHRLTSLAWASWHHAYTQQIEGMTKLRRVLVAMIQYSTLCCFRKWRCVVHDHLEVSFVMSRMSRYREVGALTAWRAAVAEAMHVAARMKTIAQVWGRMGLARGCRRWQEVTGQLLHAKLVVARAVGTWRVMLCGRALHGWHAWYQERIRSMLALHQTVRTLLGPQI